MREWRLLSQELLARIRSLRHRQTTPESFLWSILRARGFLGLKFRRQHPLGPFIADFYCDELRWVIEVDGGQHNTDEARAYDRDRSAYLATRGLTVTRLWSNHVMEEMEGVAERLAEIANGLAQQKMEQDIALPLPLGEAGRRPGEGALDAARNGSTLTPALSQREREQDTAARGHAEREQELPSPLPLGEAGRRPGEGAGDASRIGGTLTPALSQREREEETTACCQREQSKE